MEPMIGNALQRFLPPQGPAQMPYNAAPRQFMPPGQMGPIGGPPHAIIPRQMPPVGGPIQFQPPSMMPPQPGMQPGTGPIPWGGGQPQGPEQMQYGVNPAAFNWLRYRMGMNLQ